MRATKRVMLAVTLCATGAVTAWVLPWVERARFLEAALEGVATLPTQFEILPSAEGGVVHLAGADAARLALQLEQLIDPEFGKREALAGEFHSEAGDVVCERLIGATSLYNCSIYLSPAARKTHLSPFPGAALFQPSSLKVEVLRVDRTSATIEWEAGPQASALAEFCEVQHGRFTRPTTSLECRRSADGGWSGQISVALERSGPSSASAPVHVEEAAPPSSGCQLFWPDANPAIATRRLDSVSACRAWCQQAVMDYGATNPGDQKDHWFLGCRWQGAPAEGFANPSPRVAVPTLTELSHTLADPAAVIADTPTPLRLRASYRPAEFEGPFELVSVSEAGAFLETLDTFTSPRTARSRGAEGMLLVTSSVRFQAGPRHLAIRAPGEHGWLQSAPWRLDVFPPGIPTGLGGLDTNAGTVTWCGREVVANELIVSLKPAHDFGAARALATSVGMKLCGYWGIGGTWTFCFDPRTRTTPWATRLSQAARTLEKSPLVRSVEPDGVVHGLSGEVIGE